MSIVVGPILFSSSIVISSLYYIHQRSCNNVSSLSRPPPSHHPLPSSSSSSSSATIFQVQEFFPNASINGIKQILSKYKNASDAIQYMAEMGYEKDVKKIERKEKEKEIDFTSQSWDTSKQYREEALSELFYEYCWIQRESLKRFFAKNKYHYHPTRKLIREKSKGSFSYLSIISDTSIIHNMRSLDLEMKKYYTISDGLAIFLRYVGKDLFFNPKDPILVQELQWIKTLDRNEQFENDRELAEQINEQMAAEDGTLLECGCCFSEYAFESIVQCSEGHLFCKNCLKQYVETTVFADGKSNLNCMSTSESCCGFFPGSMLRSSLPIKVLEKYEEAYARDSIQSAKIELISCYNCQVQVDMSDNAGIIMRCPCCYEETCKLCGEEAHIPLKCSEVEKKQETNSRLLIEENMTMKETRTCPKCKKNFIRSHGCNKVTCPCGASICYICRADISIQGYSHFGSGKCPMSGPHD